MSVLDKIFAKKSGNGNAEANDQEKALEKRIVKAGKVVIAKTLDRHYATVQTIQAKGGFANVQLISPSLVVSKELSWLLKRKIKQTGQDLQQHIYGVAQQFEDQTFKSVEEALSLLRLTPFDRKRAVRICESQKEMHVSYQSLRMAIELFSEMNAELLSAIELARSSADVHRETDLLLKNSLLVYELANAIVCLLENFHLNGRETLLEVRQVILAEIESNRKDDQKLERECTNPNLAGSVREQALSSIHNRERLRKIVRNKWDDFIGKINQMEGNASLIIRQTANLRMIRDNAKNQLGFLQIVAVTQMMRDNLEAVQGLLRIEDIPLAPVSPDDLCRLLGIDRGADKAASNQPEVIDAPNEDLPKAQSFWSR